MFTKSIRSVLVIFGVALFLLAIGSVSGSSSLLEQAKLTAADREANDNLGYSVALDGNTALVGAYRADVDGIFEAGSAYVFDGDRSWKLTASDGEADDRFGEAVAIRGNTALVGARLGGTTDTGAVYVYQFDGSDWVEQDVLTASDGQPNDRFGISVALGENTILVGADLDDRRGKMDAGSAYLYRWSGSRWVEQAKLTASDGESGDQFGRSVALSGNTALVGAQLGDAGDVTDAGAAYVYRWDGNTWVEQAKLTASDGGADDDFGASVALSGNTALVGALSDDPGGYKDAGSAYLYRWDGGQWVEMENLIAKDQGSYDNFGASVSINRSTVLVGAARDDFGPLSNVGSAYMFRWDGSQWVEKKLTASDAAENERFGQDVALGDETALVGAVFGTVEGTVDAGAAYFYELGP